jgi:hypothetical protein
MLQGETFAFAKSSGDPLRKLLLIVASSTEVGLLEKQLLCGKTSQLMATVLDEMLAALQVLTPLHFRVFCHNMYG